MALVDLLTRALERRAADRRLLDRRGQNTAINFPDRRERGERRTDGD